MTARYRFFQLLGLVSVIGGCVLGIALIRMMLISQLDGFWGALKDLMVGAMAAYFIYIGLRAFRFGDSQEKPVPRFRWGRMLVGALLIFTNANNHFHPAPNLLKASNQTQDMAMNVTALAMSIAGLYLIVWGMLPRKEAKIPSLNV
jgi:hypothetical protein